MLNFSKFQKVAEDDKTVTMRHEKGHEMRILLKQLRPIEREQIKRLKMADGGEVPSDASTESSEDSKSVSPDQNKPVTVNVVTSPQPSPQAPLAQPAQVPPAVAPNFNPPQEVPVAQNTGNPTNAALTQSKALQMGQQAGNAQQAVDTAKAQGSVPIAQQQQQNAISNAQRIDNSIQNFQQHTNDMARYLSDPKNTNPSAFYENMGVPQKISTALGLILGGFKQGVAGGNNPAYDWLKDQQEKDISAQKQRSENQKTVWSAYNTLYGNENVSTELAKKSWADKLAADANVLTARLGTPQAAVNNQKFQADLLKSGYENLQKAAFLANQPMGSSGHSQGNPGQLIEPSGNKKSTYGPESADKTGVYNFKTHIVPDADERLRNLQRRADAGDPTAKDDLHDVKSELEDARKRELILAQAPEAYKAMLMNATTGGHIGRNIGHTAAGVGGALGEMLGGVKGAAVGAALGEGLGSHVTDIGNQIGDWHHQIDDDGERSEFRKDEDYTADRSKLADFISKLFPGSSQESQDAKLRGIMPDKPSDRENVIKHMKTFEDLVKAGGEYEALRRNGMYID